ncbi:hypothetical protein ACKAV7_009921 [Fusarium commune]|uniref:Uncharacterized protein n=1 Tax=Fusarium oxysporum f. sp. rapae TaxID=485398 RepID=A0A8J5NYN4_FUSOX|nr:hypothetical protein Forpe1208_v009815 [Fusarium oxysporum f. sp. rapae]
MSSQRVTFDPANLPRPENLFKRREYIDQYIQRFHSDLVPQIAEKRKASYRVVCKFYHKQRGNIEVPSVYFEYVIDKTMWKNIFKPLGKHAAPAWPWAKGPDGDDMSSGMSTAYRQWRIENSLPIAPQQEADTPSSTLINRINDPGVTDQLDFESLVLRENGRDIDAINNDIVEPDLMISLEIYSAVQLDLVVPLGLVIGFKNEASLALPQVQRNLLTLWCNVVAWFCEVVVGGTVSLASYLRVMQVTSYSVERTPSHEKADILWQDALRQPQDFASQARKARETLQEWTPMIQQIVDKPFGEAEQELGLLIWSNDADLVERKRRLAIVREVWLYGSRKPEAIRRAFNWLTYFSATL